jgi:transposase InsO family protein
MEIKQDLGFRYNLNKDKRGMVIVDLYSRSIFGDNSWLVFRSETDQFLNNNTIRNAIIQRSKNPGIIFHSDRGSQYASEAVRDILQDTKMIQSMSQKGNCYENAVMESFFYTLKQIVNF